MRYIRTKDGIIKIDSEIEAELPAMIRIHTEEGEVREYRGKEIIRQADTIEKLIDVYVCDELIFLSMEQLNHYCYIRNKDIYGAIWTSKGLIYCQSDSQHMGNEMTDEERKMSEELEAFGKTVKALDVIKKKEVDVHNFKDVIIKQRWTYEQYLDEENDENTTGHQFAYELLTRKEFDLLKEVLL